ncbi:MAG: choice-of-anchor B family protein [bacterium]|nr:choice-of-anchor B family protein [bacterium]
MKIFLLITSIFFISLNISYSQLPNQNTYLLRNLDVAGRSYSALWGYVADDGREYAILGCNTGTAFIDITDSANIREVDFVTGLSSNWREMKTYSHYAYIVSEATNSKLQIVDLQYLPDSVRLVTTWDYPNYTKTHSISQSGRFLYLNGGNVTLGGTSQGGVAILDLTNPVAPVKRGQWSTRYVHDCRVLNDTIWACNISDQKVSVITATNKDNLQEVTNWNNLPNPSPHNSAITDNRKYILVTDENQTPGKLKVWNIQDLSNITFVTSWAPTGITTSIVHNVEIYGNYAVVAHYTSGIRIINISNPAAPVEVAWYDTRPQDNSNNYSGCWGVYKFPSGKIIGSDMSNGLFVIKTNFPMTDITANTIEPVNYSLSQNFPNPFNPSTKINFSIKENSFVKMNVVNMEGRLVAEVVNDRRDAGNYEITFDAGKYQLSSGTYFYELQVENNLNKYSETKKMFLIK